LGVELKNPENLTFIVSFQSEIKLGGSILKKVFSLKKSKRIGIHLRGAHVTFHPYASVFFFFSETRTKALPIHSLKKEFTKK
jgi:hypothetical protein